MRTRDPLTIALLLTAVWTVAVAAFAFVAIRGAAGAVGDSLRGPVEPSAAVSPQLTEVVIESGSLGADIVETLVERGIIEDTRRLELLLDFSGVAAELRAGRYEFPTPAPAAEVIRKLSLGLTSELLLAIPEGRRLEELGEIVEDAEIATETEWAAALAAPRERPFLASRPEGADLLGYLLPASFATTPDTTADELVNAMLDTFAEQITPDLIAEAEAQGMTLHEVLTLASIVEREAVVPDERPTVASVFRNRLELGMPLQADPTVQYAIASEESVAEYGWWKQELTIDDLAFDSPYNTYLYAGLPPGPIANPGIDAIIATIRPADTDYLYFVAMGDGSHAFAETLEEHNANVERYMGPR